MNIFLLFFALLASSLDAQVLFRPANSFEKDEIHNTMITLYAEQLIQANLFENKNEAIEAALAEVDQAQLDDERQIFYILASEDNEIQYGYFVYSFKGQTAYLEAIYLNEKHQGKGLGKQVLHHFETSLLENGIHILRLYVFAHNKRAIELYNKMGYEIETTYYVDDRPIGHHMKKYRKTSLISEGGLP